MENLQDTTPTTDSKFVKTEALKALTGAIKDKAGAQEVTDLDTAVDSLATRVGTVEDDINDLAPKVHKHTTADITDLSAALEAKADTTTVTALSDTVSDLTTTVSTKADVADVTTLSGTVTNLSTTVGTKADTTTVTTLSDTVSTLSTTVANKADKTELAAYAKTADVNTALTGKAPTDHSHTEASKTAAGFMSATDKAKLDTVAQNANNYTHPTHSPVASGLYKVVVDNEGHVSAATPVLKTDIVDLGIPGQDTTYTTASTGADGLMSAADKVKLNGIDTNANKTVVDSAMNSESTNPVQNKVVHAELAKKSNTGHTHTTAESKVDSFTLSTLENSALTPAVNDTLNTVIGKIYKAIQDNEEVISAALICLKNTMGVLSTNAAMPSLAATNYLSGITNFYDAIVKLDAEIAKK